MSAKSSLQMRLKRVGLKKGFVPVPEERRPTAESIKKMGIGLTSYLESNDTMRTRSMSNASSRFTSQNMSENKVVLSYLLTDIFFFIINEKM